MEEEGKSTEFKELEDLLKKTHDLARENNKLLKRMERNALISFFAKLIIWLLILGVPLFFLSAYLTPLISELEGGTATSTVPMGLFGLPSAEQMQKLIQLYKQPGK